MWRDLKGKFVCVRIRSQRLAQAYLQACDSNSCPLQCVSVVPSAASSISNQANSSNRVRAKWSVNRAHRWQPRNQFVLISEHSGCHPTAGCNLTRLITPMLAVCRYRTMAPHCPSAISLLADVYFACRRLAHRATGALSSLTMSLFVCECAGQCPVSDDHITVATFPISITQTLYVKQSDKGSLADCRSW